MFIDPQYGFKRYMLRVSYRPQVETELYWLLTDEQLCIMFTKIRYHGFVNADILSFICLLESSSELFKISVESCSRPIDHLTNLSKIKITCSASENIRRGNYCKCQLILINKAGDCNSCIQREEYYITMLESPSYLYTEDFSLLLRKQVHSLCM